MKKLLCLVLVLCMGGAALAEGTTYRVGICQLVQHVALDAATQGFQDALKEKLGDAVDFDVQNASGDSNTCSTIMNTFVSNDVDLIMANATPALQAAVSATTTIGASLPSEPIPVSLTLLTTPAIVERTSALLISCW